ncbi:hypothetical protein OPV22_029014 [Ensete ventricosum]|uniref:TFIIS N-terminal domain-containing protein n=1 Tax=Ensete ventricosum TaxID=4639 RepID=A0AAV8PZZ8_ENSVE|nr:hypothetical protein OPV22_029014 [Ensete ventricosum]
MGVPVLDDWLQEVHKGKPADGRMHRDSDKVTCNIGKSVNNLCAHKNLEIQKKARSLVDTWKKRVNAEISKTNDAKSVGSGRAVSCSVKPCYSDVSHLGNKRSGSANVAAKMHSTQPSACRELCLITMELQILLKRETFPASIVVSSTDPHCKTVEEKSSGSIESQNNSDQAKTIASSWKEEARSSTAGSTSTSKASWVMTLEKASQCGQTSERPTDVPVDDDHGNTNSLIVRLPNHGRSHRRSASGDSFEDPLVMSSRSSSPDILDVEHGKFVDRIITACLSSRNENVVSLTRPKRRNSCSSIHALIESCAKYSEAITPLVVGDDMGMNLPATVAAGEISKAKAADWRCRFCLFDLHPKQICQGTLI